MLKYFCQDDGGRYGYVCMDGVRINPATGRVTHVRWALIDSKTHGWLSSSAVVEVAEVVIEMYAGDVRESAAGHDVVQRSGIDLAQGYRYGKS
ncbi:hypothetical protein P3T21_007311 [Paraburkholderia sp. GAS334]